jgi:hypothetical protein
MNLEEEIQKWIKLDNTINALNKQLKELRETKHNINTNINTYMENNNKDIFNTTIQLPNEKLKFIKVKNIQQLTFQYLETCLKEIIKNEEQVIQIINHIKEHRNVSYNTEIKRFENKN